MKARFNKFLTLLAVLLFGFGQMWADSETVPKTTDNWTGTSCSLTHAECANGSANAQKDGDASDVTYIKFRTNKNGNTMTFEVNEGYKVTGFSIRGYANDNSKAVGLTSVKYDSADPIEVNQSFPNKNAGTTYTYSNTTDEATSAIVLSFGTNAGTQIMAVITITYEETSGGGCSAPTDPAISGASAYTEGDDISLTASATGATSATFTWYKGADWATASAGSSIGTGATLAINSCATSDAGTYWCNISNGTGCEVQVSKAITVSPAAATAPSFTSPASEPAAAEYHVGDVISALEVEAAGYPVPTLQWYSNDSKSTTGATLIIGEESDSYTPSNAAESDLYYYCVASNASGDAQSEYFHVTVLPALPPCYTFTSTNPAETVTFDVNDIVPGSTGGSMKVIGNTVKNTAYGVSFESSGSAQVEVTLGSLMKKGTVISVSLWSNNTSSARTLKLNNSAGTTKATWSFTPSTAEGETKNYSYEVTDGDGLIGTNVLRLQRGSNVYLRSITVSNCGAPLYELTSAVDPVGMATVTLSKSLIAEGGTATATYSAIDAAYDFDEWQISGATIDDASANPVTITMGSTDAVITLKLKAAAVKHTVTYYDDATELGTELVNEGSNPTGAGLAPRKLGYTFGGWSTTNGGTATALSGITVNADLPLYAVWNAVDCASKSGVIYTMSIVVAPAANCTIKTAEGYSATWDLYQYEGITGGEATLGNTGGSNDCILQTNKTVLLKGNPAFLKLDFDCPLKEGDKIRSNISGNTAWVSTDATRPSAAGDALTVLPSSSTGEFVIPAASDLIDAQTIYIWKGGGNTTITSINVYRPAKYAVTFNMHGHGDAVDPQYIVEGGKVTEPATTSITGWDFGGWYKESTFENAWDFANDVVGTSAIELHAKWTEHVLSSDVALGTLSVNGEAITIVPSQTVYNVELPMGTSAIPTVAATAHDANAKACTVTQATAVDGSATVYIKAEDNTTEATYTINFSVATSKDIELVWDKTKKRCDDTTPTANVKSDDASVSAYVNKITFTGGGAEGSSLNVGNTAGNMFTLTAKAGYAFKAMSFFGKIQDATCEYSLDGGAWTELTSTNTSGDACYADVFSAAEVHELRLRSTGTSGVWIRNMQLTMIEACTPITLAWDEEPVEFEVGKAGYAIAATANNAGEVAYSSNATSIVDVNASTGVLTIAGLGSATLKAATAEGDGSTYCANGGNPVEISKVVNTYYLVTFDKQNETSVDEVKYYSGDAAIAQPAEPSYSGFDFQGWFDAATGGNPIAWPLTPSASMTVYAQWVAQCDGPTITVQPASANYLTGRAAAALSCEATAGNGGALTYTWYSCDDDVRTNPVELAGAPTPSTAVAGTFYFFCAVTEEGCAVIANSDVATIVVTDKDPICLAWVNVTGQNAASLDPSKSIFEPEISASGIKNSSDFGGKTGWKFNSSPAALEIENAPFKAGDIVEVFVTTVSDDKMRVFKADEGIAANVVAEGAANMVQGANRVALTEDANNLYLLRKNDFGGWNPYVAYVAVYRACAPILNKITVAGVEGAPVGNVVTVEVPASTTQSQLEAITYDWVSNNDAWTAAHDPAVANAWEFGVENTVTFTDKDGDASVYTITVNKAAASANVELATLTVNGNAVAVVPGQAEYNYELPYGTSAAPTVAATAADANAEVGVITQAASATGSATFTVTAEDGTTTRDYTVNFSISKWAEVVIWDGSTMSAVATSPDATTGFAWAVTGFGSIDSYSTTYGEKSYSKYLPSGGTAPGRYVALNVPAGYVAKFYIVMASHSDGNERGMFIGSNLVKDPDATSVLELSNNDRDIAVAGMSEVAGAGTWYINPNASIDFQEIRAYLRPGYARTSMLGNGVLGTVCVDHNVAVEDIQGVSVYELMGREPEYGKLAFDEIVSGELEAGAPYVFLAHGDRMVLFYGNTKVDEPVDKHNGMYGTFTNQTLTELDDVYYFAQKALWGCSDLASLSVPANRAYVKLSEIDYLTPGSSPAPGRRRITLNVNGENAAQGFENIEAGDAPLKIMIDGTLYILRGEKVYNANGQLVK